MRAGSAGAVCLVLSTAGCAAVLGSHQKTFDLQSSPQSADVYVDGNRLGVTPLRVRLDNHKDYTFVFRREGYKEASCSLNKATGAGWVIFDVISGLVPVVIDAATNSWTQTQGSHCTGNLEALPRASRFAYQAPPARPHLEDAPEAPSQTIRTPAPTEPEPSPGPGGHIEVPPGPRYVADIRRKLYYVIACVDRPELIAPENRYYYQTEAAAQADGYLRAADCWEGRD